jgi:hypothetical protein
VTARRRTPKDLTRDVLLEEAWSIIRDAKAKANYAAASATLERAARIAGLWSEKPAADDAAGPPPAQVFTSEPLTPEQWSEKFAPKED